MCRNKLILILLPIFFLLISCQPLNRNKHPHNDVLVFGTSTKFAADFSAPIQAAGMYELTLGYKRLEAVWMPLKPNGNANHNPVDDVQTLINNLGKCTNDSNLKKIFSDGPTILAKFCLTMLLPKGKYVSVSSGLSQDKGGETIEIDTYSVFASLGGKTNFGLNSASGSIAQFFATGVAAQRLGANSAIGLALNANSAKAEEEKAKSEAEIQKTKQAEIDANLKLALGEKGLSDAVEKGTKETALLTAKNAEILASVTDEKSDLDQSKWNDLVDSSSLDDTEKTKLKELSSLTQVSAYLSGKASLNKSDNIDALHNKIKREKL